MHAGVSRRTQHRQTFHADSHDEFAGLSLSALRGIGTGIAVLVPFLGQLPFGALWRVPEASCPGKGANTAREQFRFFFSRLIFQLANPVGLNSCPTE